MDLATQAYNIQIATEHRLKMGWKPTYMDLIEILDLIKGIIKEIGEKK